jgi:hypothetical protein
MTEEKSQDNIENTSNKEEDNYAETREISILKRNLRLAKRIILGTKKPPFFLKIVSWVFLGWSLLMVIFNLFVSLTYKIGNTVSSKDYITHELWPKYFMTYSLLHLVALIGVILMYRKKLTGFYIFSIATICMPFWEYLIFQEKFKFEFTVLLFSIVAIALFGANWRIFDANVRKREKKKQLKREAEMYRNSINR